MKVIETEHLARVEGHGTVAVFYADSEVKEVRFNIYEGPRLIERLAVGRSPEEVISIVPRICAICSVSHKLAAIRAMENVLSVSPPRKVLLLRELLHLGEQIESHSLHVYYLALPDYLGFPSAVAMADKFNFEVKIALEMKKFGNRIMKTIAGRFIHGENPVIGGFGKLPADEDLAWIKQRAQHFLPFTLKTAALFSELEYPDIPETQIVFACLNPPGNAYGLMGDEIIVSTGDGLGVREYRRLTNEEVVPYSFCKHSRYKGRPFMVGALARVNLLGGRLEGRAGEMYEKHFSEKWKNNPLYNNAAQALEILFAMERIPGLIDGIIGMADTPSAGSEKKEGNGAGAVEAPGGTLYHYYEVSNGLVADADIITATAQNAADIERVCFHSVEKLLKNGEIDKIDAMITMIVRAYDPCISCSVH